MQFIAADFLSCTLEAWKREEGSSVGITTWYSTVAKPQSIVSFFMSATF